ncbi:transketolase [Solimonas aquatica]|uniref:transketolase n=1 Tax=Solimonas aquatica TaxID=489703 RepID=UPI001C433440|nr:transketolase [Solimonas aquatica]
MSSRQAANALRALAMDAVEAAKSGHPGMPMGMADIAEVLWLNFMKFDPAHPDWFDRDRFVLSNGHGSMLLYALLHLSGFDLPIEQLRRFRQLHSRTPGHPEYGLTPGVDTTTGPLGQGLGNAVGMALAEQLLAAEFNRPDFPLVDHWTYVFAGDGCLMEGISQEAISLAGTLRLDKLVVFYDDNGISIDGAVHNWFADDTAARFEACGWRVIRDVDGHDAEALMRAIVSARARSGKPVLVICKTVIGYGSPDKAGQASVHGAPLGSEGVARAKEALGWKHPPFMIPQEIYAHWDKREEGEELHYDWESMLYRYERAHPQLAAEFKRRIRGELPESWPQLAEQALAQRRAQTKPEATRKSSEHVLNACAPALPELFGGSADLSESNNTYWHEAPRVLPGKLAGRYLSYGVREFGMAAAMNGIAAHGGLIPYGGTFAVFSDYARNAIRMSALMRLRVIYVLSHDSIGLGEDGPTHQPVEHAASLRLIPHLQVWRPCDGVETAMAWRCALERREGPSVLMLSRQALQSCRRDAQQEADIARGGYVLSESKLPLEVVLMATGSEIAVALTAQSLLAEDGIGARVVSMPCTNRFDAQEPSWRASVLPPGLPRVAVEAAHPDFWRKYVGLEGAAVGIEDFGESAPAAQLMDYFGITAARVAEVARSRVRTGAAPSAAEPTLIVRSIN